MRTGPEVAARVAADQLRALPGEPEALACDIDWAGPVERELPDEQAVQAACGIMHVHGRAAGRPRRLGVDYASTLAGVLAAQGVLAASLARARGARFSSVRTSVAEAALLSVQQYLAVATTDDDWVETWQAGGRPPFTSRDGVRFELEVLHAEGWLRFWAELGADSGAVADGWWPFQQRFATAAANLPEALHRALREVDYGTVASVAASAGVSVLPVRDDPAPPAAVPACAFRALPGTARFAQRRGVAPLDGIVVVESTRRIQGPLVGHLLRMLGAEVVRVEPPGGDAMRGVPPMSGDCSARFRALNDGKRTVELDVKSPSGRRELCELVADADAFVHNWAPGKAAQLALDAGDLARVSPGLVYAWSSGWEPLRWPEPPVGTDFLVQAHSGLAAAVQSADEPSAPSLMTLTDVLGGAVSAMGVLAALLHRQRTGEGVRVDSSLFSSAGVVPRPPRRSVLDQPLRTSDGFAVLSGTDPARLAAALGTAPDTVPERLRQRPSGFWAAELSEVETVVTPVCTDLRQLAADPRFAAALGRDTHAFPLAPWEFS
ncbi:CoA transferase [Saccharopolyspora antimicrobica]|uniref:CoA transferase n=1 Tax=Saccharopolyspora antimicrobica TaxID=455193 RepID=UPI001FE3926F|nr:CoA transferase [Saccharopolyspora antimicrobica]